MPASPLVATRREKSRPSLVTFHPDAESPRISSAKAGDHWGMRVGSAGIATTAVTGASASMLRILARAARSVMAQLCPRTCLIAAGPVPQADGELTARAFSVDVQVESVGRPNYARRNREGGARAELRRPDRAAGAPPLVAPAARDERSSGHQLPGTGLRPRQHPRHHAGRAREPAGRRAVRAALIARRRRLPEVGGGIRHRVGVGRLGLAAPLLHPGQRRAARRRHPRPGEGRRLGREPARARLRRHRVTAQHPRRPAAPDRPGLRDRP